MIFEVESIGTVHNSRKKIDDDFWGGVVSEIVIEDRFPIECLKGIEEFSHVEILYYFDKVIKSKIDTGARRPRNNPDWEEVGIFAQRGKNRPNQIGLTVAKLNKKRGRSLFVEGLDAIDGTPVLDIKPVIIEFLPNEEIVQPQWASELMKDYWRKSNEQS